MVSLTSLVFGVAGIFFSARCASGKGFLRDEHSSFTVQMLDRDLQTAMEEVMGCGSRKASPEALERIKFAVQPMWNTMPKNTYGKLEWRSLRYVAHRYFMQKSSMLIRGMEPSLALSEETTGAAEILANTVPSHVNEMLGGDQSKQGYAIDDGVALLAALEQLVFDSEAHLLEDVYTTLRVSNQRHLSRKHMRRLLEGYMVHWMLGEDKDSIRILMQNRSLLEAGFPHWQDLKGFVDGRIRLMDFQRAKSLSPGVGRSMMDASFSFDDAHTVIGGITSSFQAYWESECVTMKQQLVEMDKSGTGRVKLSDFYGTGMDEDWRFGESEAYLRELGVLDESSPWLGKQVVIPNYLLAASNCIVSTPHYLICCQNECETLLREIEDGIGEPMANPADILRIVNNLTSSGMEDSPVVEGGLSEQLHKVAQSHGGKVPLHGRLFAQWMHYAYPRECPFPHKTGTFSKAHTLTPEKYGDNYIASAESMVEVVTQAASLANETAGQEPPANKDEQWMSQWSLEEELFADYTHMKAPWEGHRWASYLAFVGFAGLAAFAAISGWSPQQKKTAYYGGGSSLSGMDSRPHMV